jgi:ribosomal protein S18 acetylase RimI-like enzyme
VSAIVRVGTAEDRTFVVELGRATVMDSVAAFRHTPPPFARASLDRLFEVVEGQSHVLLIAEVDGERAGFLYLLDEFPEEVTGDRQGFIAYMAVDPARRGAGIGASLLAAAEDEARRRALPYMALMVTEENLAARRLYERNGYVTERRLLSKQL